MRDDPIPDSDHVSRYSRAAYCTENGEVTSAAFLLRSGEEYLSVNWLEFLGLSNRSTEIEHIRGILRTKLTLARTGRIAVLNVGSVRQNVLDNTPDRRNLRLSHQPEDRDPSHSGIFDLGPDIDLVAELMAQSVIETHPAETSL